MAKWFDGKVAWITGAGSGIGRATALELGRHGCRVVLSGRRQERLDAVATELDSLGSEGLVLPCDVVDEKQIATTVEQLISHFGQLDLAFANAGFAVAGKVEELDAESWRRQLDVNVVGAALTARHALAHLRKTRGRIGLVGSVVAFLCAPKLGPYSASKYAVRALGQTLSIELHGSGVSCTTVHPGYVESEIAQVDNDGNFDAGRPDKRPKQFLWPADRAAQVIVKALYRRKREVVFTGHGKVGAFIGQHLPSVAHLMMRRR